jgi:hypothetical protein
VQRAKAQAAKPSLPRSGRTHSWATAAYRCTSTLGMSAGGAPPARPVRGVRVGPTEVCRRSIPPTESSKGMRKELWLWLWLCAPWRARGSSGDPLERRGDCGSARRGAHRRCARPTSGQEPRRRTPQAAREPGGQEARKARKRGVLSLGYFSLDEQREVTRLPDGRRNPSQGRHNNPRRRRTLQDADVHRYATVAHTVVSYRRSECPAAGRNPRQRRHHKPHRTPTSPSTNA